MADTFLKYIDTAMRVRVWDKFKTELGVSVMNTQSAFMTFGTALRHVSEKQANDQLPFMNIWRSAPEYAWDRQQSGLGNRGVATGAAVSGEVDEIRTVPVTLKYDVWLWGHDMDVMNSIVEKYMFWQYQDPNLDIQLNGTYPLEMDLHFGSPEDISPIDAMYEKGLYFVMRIPITVDAWIFSASFVKLIYSIIVRGLDNTIDPDGELMFTNTQVGALMYDALDVTDAIVRT